MTQETRIALLLMGELVTALRANDPDTFKRCLELRLAGGEEPLNDVVIASAIFVRDTAWIAVQNAEVTTDRGLAFSYSLRPNASLLQIIEMSIGESCHQLVSFSLR